MAELPWFAWIAIVGIIIWGIVAMVGSITGRPHQSPRSSIEDEEIAQLRKRIEQLEAHLYRGA